MYAMMKEKIKAFKNGFKYYICIDEGRIVYSDTLD